MFNYLDKLRQKPDSTKKWVAFLVSFSFTGIIFVVWLTVLYPNFREENRISEKVPSQDPTPFGTLSGFLEQSSAMFDSQNTQSTADASATTSDETATPDTTTSPFATQ